MPSITTSKNKTQEMQPFFFLFVFINLLPTYGLIHVFELSYVLKEPFAVQ